MDIKTLFIIIFLVNLFLGIFTYKVKQKHKHIIDVSYWIIANFVLAASYIFFGLRNIIPDLFSIVLANVLAFFTIIIRYLAFKKLYNKSIIKSEFIVLSTLSVLLIFLLSYFTYVDDNIYYRTISVRIEFAIMTIYLGVLMLKNTPKNEKLVGHIASGGYFIFAALSIPYILSWIYNPEYRHLFAPNIYSYLMLVTNLFLDIIWSTSLLYISSQRSFEKHIESEKRLKSLFDNSHDGIVMLNKDGQFVDFNSAYCNMLGYSRQELLNLDFYVITPEKWHDWERKEVIEKLASDNTFTITYEKEYIHKNKEPFPVELSAFAAKDIEGESHYWGIVKDITERKRHEQQIENQNAKLVELNATKDKFISILAHDLKNPFSTMLLTSEILQDEVKAGKISDIADSANIIHKTTKNTYQLLENLLQWAHSQQNRISFYPQKINLALAVNECGKIVKGNAVAKKIDVIFDIAENQFVYADDEMVKTIIRNLLSNAIKFTPVSGKICVSSNIINDLVEINISDNGVGMDEKSNGTLFKIGKTKSARGTDGETGTGFGLILCKEFVEKQGGNIWVESEIDKGSNFKFTLPAYISESEL